MASRGSGIGLLSVKARLNLRSGWISGLMWETFNPSIQPWAATLFMLLCWQVCCMFPVWWYKFSSRLLGRTPVSDHSFVFCNDFFHPFRAASVLWSETQEGAVFPCFCLYCNIWHMSIVRSSIRDSRHTSLFIYCSVIEQHRMWTNFKVWSPRTMSGNFHCILRLADTAEDNQIEIS